MPHFLLIRKFFIPHSMQFGGVEHKKKAPSKLFIDKFCSYSVCVYVSFKIIIIMAEKSTSRQLTQINYHAHMYCQQHYLSPGNVFHLFLRALNKKRPFLCLLISQESEYIANFSNSDLSFHVS